MASGDPAEEARRELEDAENLLAEGREGASPEWLAAAEDHVSQARARYLATRVVQDGRGSGPSVEPDARQPEV